MSCGNEKIVQLPEITHSEVSEILDVSAAYLFYDETKKDSIELNRKSIIGTTNWLVNVDKRLTLKQAIPKIIYLQDKKRNAEVHKNAAAKNYYTCNNSSIKNLGFIEFTDVYYKEKQSEDFTLEPNTLVVLFNSDSDIELKLPDNETIKTSKATLLEDLKTITSKNVALETIQLFFNKNLTFQNYITFKSLLNQLNNKQVLIANDEFIFY
ncbi:hypothetical protein GCM10010976_28180 [Bizionia arctica]|uniref:Uncharacterized protein n=2 Tax=Bizionia arctica TaxID=1495645 RepID=A0A917GSY5_9FLAO|nr:hypothetical protein GCM10010976_28180 [Bizionia arctica]